MAIEKQNTTDRYAIYHGDCLEVMPNIPSGSVHLSVYSPPFCGLYHYSSSERDLSNCRSYDEFFEHYEYVVREVHRVTAPGRITAVHCMMVPLTNKGTDLREDFPGDIIRLHQKCGFGLVCKFIVRKEPLGVRIRTMMKCLEHQRAVIEDSSCAANAGYDELVIFRRNGDNKVPIRHPNGFLEYAGAREIPRDLLGYRGYTGKQTENPYSQWIWRQYADAVWDDIRIDRVLPFQPAKDKDDVRHVHPLQLDVIDRCIGLWSNPGEVVFTPFMGVGSEVYSAVNSGATQQDGARFGIGVELKDTYYRQALANLESIKPAAIGRQMTLGCVDDGTGRAEPGGDGYPGAKRTQYFGRGAA